METLVSTDKITKDSPIFTLDQIETLFKRLEAINSKVPSHRRKRLIISDWIGNKYPLKEIKLDVEGNLYLGGITLPLANIAGILVGSL